MSILLLYLRPLYGMYEHFATNERLDLMDNNKPSQNKESSENTPQTELPDQNDKTQIAGFESNASFKRNQIHIADFDDNKTQIAGIQSSSTSFSNNIEGVTLCDRYQVDKLIGQGGMCDIYRAYDRFFESEKSEKFVAIKVLQRQYSDTPEAVDLLRKEAERSRELSHPHIVRVYHADKCEDLNFIVMEYIEGETLDALIRRSRPAGVGLKKAKVILNQVIDALSHAHQLGVIHTDLKPSNIMITSHGEAKLLDFGIARTEQCRDLYAYTQEVVDEGVAGYTPAYASPEQLNGSDASIADDVFSLSCIAYELVASKHPFDKVAANKIKADFQLKKPSGIHLLAWQALKLGLSLKAANRPASIEQLRKGLNRSLKMPLATAASIILFLGIIYSTFDGQSTSYQELEAKYLNTQAQNKQIEDWMQWRGQDVLIKLGDIPPQYDALKQGLLRLNQERILNSFAKRAEDESSSANSEVRDFTKMLQIYEEAKKHFPDSKRLSDLVYHAESERQSVVDGIVEKLELLLSQGRYEEEGRNGIGSLIQQLKFVSPASRYQPSEACIALYSAEFDKAMQLNHAARLQVLLRVGEQVFLHEQALQPLLEKARELKSAIEALAQYEDKVSQGLEAKYPAVQAELFYENAIADLTQALQAVKGPKDLIALEAHVGEFSRQVPTNFAPIRRLKEDMAKRYLSLANQLMEKRRYRIAKDLISRSDRIYSELSKTTL